MSPQAQNIIERLEAIRQKWWIFTLLSSALWAVSASLALFMLFSVVDALFRLSQTGLILGFGVWLAATVAFGVFVLRRLFRSQRTLEGTARCLESEYPELQSNLINLIQLSEDTRNENRDFCNAAVDQAAREVARFSLDRVAIKESRFRRFLYCLQTPRDLAEAAGVFALLLGLSVLGSILLPNWSSAASRLTKPWTFVPSVGTIKLTVSPGNTEVLAGSPLEVHVDTREPVPANADAGAAVGDASNGMSAVSSVRATLYFQVDGSDAEESLPLVLEMSPANSSMSKAASKIATEDAAASSDGTASADAAPGMVNRRYIATIPVVAKALRYRVEVGDSQSEIYRALVLEKPSVGEVEITYKYPEYMKKTPQVVRTRTPDLVAPQYTTAELNIRPSIPITAGRLDWEGGGISGEVRDEGRLLAAKMDLSRNTTYKIRLQKGDFEDPQPRINNVTVEIDRAPNVEMLRPTGETSVTLGQTIPIAAKLTDDFGISAAWLETKLKDGQNADPEEDGENTATSSARDNRKDAVSKIHTWAIDATAQSLQHAVEYSITLSEQLAKPGQTLLVRVVAQDNRRLSSPELHPQQTAGPWRAIKVIDKEAAAETMQTQLDSIRDSLRKLMEKQVRNRLRTAMIGTKNGHDERLALAGEVRTVQIEIQKEAIRIVKSITGDDRPEDQLIKRDLNKLAFMQMTGAVEQADEMLKSPTAEAFEKPAEELQQTQGVIIDTLRNLLGVSRAAEMKALEQMGMRAQNDLPDDVKRKMEALKKSLDEAMEAQRKVIEAGRALNKESVEDFSEDQEQLLKQLQAAEDAWEKFVKEATTDLSKLPFQDFANPSLLNELIEIQTELQRKSEAEDALKKSVDIAVPLEQLGYEMAEELKTNFEKWLPDTADRERWSQEESPTDADKEAPAAELPLELEDLIGELMEEEDDLFDEMEDVGSSAMDSLDAGAAWDVADGPISNMSAKGATGNRLPNTSEIGGRSGEGRQGKASGEMVGNEAVGKGGRNTPTRLTPDPFVKGQIKDHSKEQAGGATGGGKDSGEGGEGLEGPQARNRTRDTNRLPGKQADLRNRAEGIDLNHMRVMGYHNQDLEEMIDLMDQAEKDFRGGRYQNLPRVRKVMLEGLDDVKRHVGGDFSMKEDATYNLPTNIQEELVGGFDEPSPAGWEAVNRDYFRRLSEGSTAAP